MIELAYEGLKFEWCNIYQVGSVDGDDSKSVTGVLSEMMNSGKGLQSTYKRSATRLQKAIDELYNKISKISN